VTAPDPQRSGEFALSTPERIGFGVGSLATATYAVVPGLVLLYYLTNILGVTAALAGLVVFLPKLLDLVYNPIVGRLSDSTVSRLGPRRPWMIAGMITFPLGFVSIFFSPFDGDAAAVWVAGALALTGLGFSAFVIPYSVLPTELGASPAERTSMTAWRMGFLGLAILAAGAVAPMVAEADGGGREGYRVMAVAMGCVIFLGTCGALYSARCDEDEPVVGADPRGPCLGVLAGVLARRRRNAFIQMGQWEVNEIDQYMVLPGAVGCLAQNPVGDRLAVTARTGAANDYCNLEVAHESPFNLGCFIVSLSQAVSAVTRTSNSQVNWRPRRSTIAWPLT
jgi:GPH family glycoside/pentoside/hexuronide:cation symporter